MNQNQLMKLSFTGNINAFSIEPTSFNQNNAKSSPFTKDRKKMNPYFIFCKERRAALQSEYPHTPSRDITKMLAIEWKEMDCSEKEKYIDMHKKMVNDQKIEKEREIQRQIGGQAVINFSTPNGLLITLPVFYQKMPNLL